MSAPFTFRHTPGSPTLVLLHGTGGDEGEMMRLGQDLLPNAGHLAPRGNEPERGMNRFFRRLSEGVFDEPNLRMRAAELADFVVAQVPDAPRVAVGFSNGANIAAATLLLRPDAFQGAVLLAPMVPLEGDFSGLDGVPVLLVAGERDPIVPLENAGRLAEMLRAAGAEVELRVHPGGHSVDPAGYARVKAWLAERFG